MRDVAKGGLLNCARAVYRYQLCNGYHFLREHPAGVRSWAKAPVAELLADARVGSVIGHQCRDGPRAQAVDGTWLPARRATRWMSRAPEILGRLGRRRRGWCQLRTLSAGGPWPRPCICPSCCMAALGGAAAQCRQEGRALQPAVIDQLRIFGLSGPPAGPAPAGVAPVDALQEDVAGGRVRDAEDEFHVAMGPTISPVTPRAGCCRRSWPIRLEREQRL